MQNNRNRKNTPKSAIISLLVIVLFLLPSQVAAILVLAWWATKQIARRPGLQGFGGRLPNGDMSVLAQIPLGSQQRLVVVECAARYFLLGVTEHNISMLSELSEEDVQRWTEEQEASVPEGRQSFSTLLQNKMRR